MRRFLCLSCWLIASSERRQVPGWRIRRRCEACRFFDEDLLERDGPA